MRPVGGGNGAGNGSGGGGGMRRDAPVERDASGLEVLSHDECIALLRQGVVGRVVFTAAALPAVLPVNYVVDADGSVLLRTGAQTRLATAAGDVVAFETDDVGRPGSTDTAWSVVVTGRLTIVRDPAERARVDALGLRSWVPSARDLLMRIAPELVSGRRLPAAGSYAPVDQAGQQAG